MDFVRAKQVIKYGWKHAGEITRKNEDGGGIWKNQDFLGYHLLLPEIQDVVQPIP